MVLRSMRVARAILFCGWLAALAVGSLPSIAADTLPRRGLLGVSATDTANGLTVTAVLPSLPAQAAGLRAGDVIVAIDGAPAPKSAAFAAQVRRPAGQPIVLDILRDGAKRSVRIVMAEAARERDSAVDTHYEALSFAGSLRRTLITAPHGALGKHPAVLFVGGIGCYSVDNATNDEDPYQRLAHDVGRRGFVTLRLEKSGVGDSGGPPCSTVDYATEAASYTAAFDALRADPLVDPARVYVFGAIYGSADFVTDESDHQRIVDIVNGVHPGNGRLVVVPGMDHYLTPAASQRASLARVRQCGSAPYDRRFSTVLLDWLCRLESCAA